MDNEENIKTELVVKGIDDWKEGTELLERLFHVASPEGVYSKPVSVEGQTVITASEVNVGMGFGYGAGSGTGPEGEGGSGSGGGGGGGSTGRPVAAIIISQDGVRVEPIVDPTKISLAFFTMVGSFLIMLGRMRRGK